MRPLKVGYRYPNAHANASTKLTPEQAVTATWASLDLKSQRTVRYWAWNYNF